MEWLENLKIMVISSAALPSPTMGYSGLEMICAWFTLEAVKRGHDVTLVTTKGSEWGAGSHPIANAEGKVIANLNVIETVFPDWAGENEEKHYMHYKDLMEKEFTVKDTIVWDNTWLGYSYLSKQKFPNINLIHTHHGMLGWNIPPPVIFPRIMGLSTVHAQYMSNVLSVPVRHVHNGIPLAQFEENYDPNKMKGDYLLSLNRISEEKGIHDAIDVAISTNNRIVIIGDDTKVASQDYVMRIIDRCDNSNGLAKYMGLVDTNTKNQLLHNCKAVIACPRQNYLEAFGLYCIEGQSYYKPVLALGNGGLYDIINHGKDGFLAANAESLKPFVEKLDDINPFDCRKNVETRFTKEIMSENYLRLFEKIIHGDSDVVW